MAIGNLYDFDEVNGQLIQCVLKKNIEGFYVNVRVLQRSVPDYLYMYEIEKNEDGRPCKLRHAVRDDNKFFGTFFTRQNLHLNLFRSIDLKGKDDMYEFLVGSLDKDGNPVIEGNITASLGVTFDEMFDDNSTIVPVVQTLDENGEVIDETEMTEEEFAEFLHLEEKTAALTEEQIKQLREEEKIIDAENPVMVEPSDETPAEEVVYDAETTEVEDAKVVDAQTEEINE